MRIAFLVLTCLRAGLLAEQLDSRGIIPVVEIFRGDPNKELVIMPGQSFVYTTHQHSSPSSTKDQIHKTQLIHLTSHIEKRVPRPATVWESDIHTTNILSSRLRRRGPHQATNSPPHETETETNASAPITRREPRTENKISSANPQPAPPPPPPSQAQQTPKQASPPPRPSAPIPQIEITFSPTLPNLPLTRPLTVCATPNKHYLRAWVAELLNCVIKGGKRGVVFEICVQRRDKTKTRHGFEERKVLRAEVSVESDEERWGKVVRGIERVARVMGGAKVVVKPLPL